MELPMKMILIKHSSDNVIIRLKKMAVRPQRVNMKTTSLIKMTLIMIYDKIINYIFQ